MYDIDSAVFQEHYPAIYRWATPHLNERDLRFDQNPFFPPEFGPPPGSSPKDTISFNAFLTHLVDNPDFHDREGQFALHMVTEDPDLDVARLVRTFNLADELLWREFIGSPTDILNNGIDERLAGISRSDNPVPMTAADARADARALTVVDGAGESQRQPTTSYSENVAAMTAIENQTQQISMIMNTAEQLQNTTTVVDEVRAGGEPRKLSTRIEATMGQPIPAMEAHSRIDQRGSAAQPKPSTLQERLSAMEATGAKPRPITDTLDSGFVWNKPTEPETRCGPIASTRRQTTSIRR